MADIQIQVVGLDKVMRALDKFPHTIAKYMTQAGDEAAKKQILNTEGLKKYPPSGPANEPPTPYYIRGRGTQTKSGNKGNSERLGTQFYVEKQNMNTIIGNRASYAKWVVGDEQAHFMKPKGWRKLFDVATEKKDKIEMVYNKWVAKLIKDLGL
jgi:hypothetical protein